MQFIAQENMFNLSFIFENFYDSSTVVKQFTGKYIPLVILISKWRVCELEEWGHRCVSSEERKHTMTSVQDM